MDLQLETQIKERFATLPEDIQNAIQSSDLDEQLRLIGEAHHLHIDQMGTLGDEVRLVMLGFTDSAGFANALTEQTNVPALEAEKIAAEVAEKIFTPIRESMKQFMEKRDLATAVSTVSVPPDAPQKIEEKGLPIIARSIPNESTKSVLPMAEKILTQPTTTSQVPINPASPRPYKNDPYLEPAE
jgi:hypothetical protein